MAESETGVVLIIVGVVMMSLGIFFWPVCGLGIILLIVGIVLVATHQAQPQYYYPGMYPYPQAPLGAPTTPAAGPVPFAPAACPVCGSPMTWIAQYGRWYCTRCQAYR